MSFTPDVPSTEEALAAILESPLPAVPPQEQVYGATTVSWWETDPGEVYIHAHGGTPDDRHYASTLVAMELEPHGFKRAQFDMDEEPSTPGPGDYVTTQEGYTFEVVDTTDNPYTGPEVIVRSDLDGNDMARSEGTEGIDWQYVYIPVSELRDDQHLGSRRYSSQRIPSPTQLKRYRADSECYEMASAVARKWPHLRQDAGFYIHPQRGPGDHSWNVAPDGTIVDTTSQQHPGPELVPPEHPDYGRYVSWDDEPQSQTLAHQLGYHYSPEDAGNCPLCGKTGGTTQVTRVSSWPDLMAKAKRLIMSGQVHVLRNGFNYLMGHVVGDHGEYDTEISRDDPNSRSITGWQCSCPWDQYAWQRTRKWKKFEGRPCSHAMALYWKALSTPLDEQLTEEQANALGTGQAIKAPAVPEHPPEGVDTAAEGLPRSFGPEGDIVQGEQESMNLPPGPEAIGGPPGPAQAPLSPPPGNGGNGGPQPPGVLPPFPGEQQELPWQGPGTTPGGGQSPPGAYSVPGAKPPGEPANPLQNPGTLSSAPTEPPNFRKGNDKENCGGCKMFYKGECWGYGNKEVDLRDLCDSYTPEKKTSAEFNPPEVVRLKKPVMGIAEGPVQGQYGDGEYREVQEGTSGEVRSQDDYTGWVECIFPLDNSGPHEPYHVKCFVEPSDIDHTGQSNAFIRRHT